MLIYEKYQIKVYQCEQLKRGNQIALKMIEIHHEVGQPATDLQVCTTSIKQQTKQKKKQKQKYHINNYHMYIKQSMKINID
jgi:hypothetical protein